MTPKYDKLDATVEELSQLRDTLFLLTQQSDGKSTSLKVEIEQLKTLFYWIIGALVVPTLLAGVAVWYSTYDKISDLRIHTDQAIYDVRQDTAEKLHNINSSIVRMEEQLKVMNDRLGKGGK